jgi:murein L,D-transpeptidase YafK
MILVWANSPIAPLSRDVEVDRVVVYKAERRMALMGEGEVVRTYSISLGRSSIGDKECEGDQRTPEGVYVLDYANEQSSYYYSYHISYPNASDSARAGSIGCDPGGLIMIHGLPNRLPWVGKLHRWVDWTAGCIAITNHEMADFRQYVKVGTPIEIRP